MDIRILCLLIFAIFFAGCKTKDPAPYNSDPIYQDIIKDIRAQEQAEADTLKKIEGAEKDLAKSAPRTMERKNAQNEILANQNKLVTIRQMLEYYKIREIMRKAEVKRKYDIAFEKNLEWPDKKEFEAYKINKKLMNASRNWNTRVPKPNQSPGEAKEDAPKVEEGHH